MATYPEAITEGVVGGETLAPILKISTAITDGVTGGETLTPVLKLSTAMTDGVTGGDTFAAKSGVFAILIERVALLSPAEFEIFSVDESITSSADFTAATAEIIATTILETVALLAVTAESVGAINESVVSTVRLQDALITGVATALTSSVDMSSSTSELVELINIVTEALTVNSTLEGASIISATALSSIALADIIGEALHAGIDESMDLSDVLAPRLALLIAVSESATLDAIAADTLILYAAVAESAVSSDTLAPGLNISAVLAESVSVSVLLGFAGAEYVGWVVNAEGAFPASEYTNWPFNSYAQLGTKTYAAQEDGIYEITGADDAGTNISAHILTGKFDFGSGAQKRIRSVQLGYTADEKMRLYVRTEDSGQLKEYWYEAVAITADTPREHIIKIGQGLKSMYWQFKLLNTAGGDFHLDVVRLYPVILKRRR